MLYMYIHFNYKNAFLKLIFFPLISLTGCIPGIYRTTTVWCVPE